MKFAAGPLVVLALLLASLAETSARAANDAPRRRPNIVFILADDLGYGDLGCYGQARIKTPQLDQLAAGGLRFAQAYSGNTVCAPSRCSLLTGLHTGHTRIRSNRILPLRPADVTIAEVLQPAGYTSAAVGKWALGNEHTTGVPTRQGFDHYFCYLDQNHAHNYYPDFLWRNDRRSELPNVVAKGVATRKVAYSPELFTQEAREFIERSHEQPFFLYLAYTLPHANNEAGPTAGLEVPSDQPYSREGWPQAEKNFAAMVTKLDTEVGRVLARLDELGLADDTVVFFASDNGPHEEAGQDPAFFSSSGPLRGIKRSLHEGGTRVPFIVRWPGHIAPGTTDQQAAFWDVLPTLAELAGAAAPAGIDGLSLVPTLLGEATAGHKQPQHEYLYWEFYEGGFQQAIRAGNWKGVQPPGGAALALYDLAADPAEAHDIAADHPDVVARLKQQLRAARVDSPDYPTE